MKEAPLLLDRLAPEDAEHFAEVRALLDAAGLEYEIDPTLVRGLDYYTRTVFEVESERLGAQAALGGGGRYDGLIEELGGPPTPGVGWAAGVERILLAAGEAEERRGIDVFVAGTGADAFVLAGSSAASGLRAQMEQAGRSLKGQLKQADRLGARWTVILGDEIEVKDMDTASRRRSARLSRVRDGRATGSTREASATQPLQDALGRPAPRGRRGRAGARGRLGAPPPRPRRADLHRPPRPDRAAPARVPARGGARGARGGREAPRRGRDQRERRAGAPRRERHQPRAARPARWSSSAELEQLADSETPPFQIDEDDPVGEELRLRYRYLDLRKERMRDNVILRHRVVKEIRDFLSTRATSRSRRRS